MRCSSDHPSQVALRPNLYPAWYETVIAPMSSMAESSWTPTIQGAMHEAPLPADVARTSVSGSRAAARSRGRRSGPQRNRRILGSISGRHRREREVVLGEARAEGDDANIEDEWRPSNRPGRRRVGRGAGGIGRRAATVSDLSWCQGELIRSRHLQSRRYRQRFRENAGTAQSEKRRDRVWPVSGSGRSAGKCYGER